jgi:hypothetical protein
MSEAQAAPAGPLEALIEELAGLEELHLVVNTGAAAVELRGKASARRGPQWLTLEMAGSPDHIHLRRSEIAAARPMASTRGNRAVRFFSADGRALMTVYLPGTSPERSDFKPERAQALDRVLQRHPGVLGPALSAGESS